MGSAFSALAISCLLSSVPVLPRIGVFVLEAPPDFDCSGIVLAAEQVFSSSGRFEVADVPDTIPANAQGENLIASIQALASASDLEVVLTLAVRQPEASETTRYSGDSLMVTHRMGITVGGRFYTSSGDLIGSLEQFRFEDSSSPLEPDPLSIAAGAAADLASRSLLQLFPVEIRFTAGDGGDIDLAAGASSGLKDGMFLFCVASASEIPADLSGYDLLRSRGLLQIVECGSSSARGRLLSGELAPGGPVTAVEHGMPAVLSAGWDIIPVSLEPGDPEPADFESDKALNGVRIGLSNFRWGICLGGFLSASTADAVSAINVGLRGGLRIPLSAPALSLRLTAGPDFALLMQDVTAPYLASDASAVIFGGSLEGAVEYLAGEHFGFTLGASASLSSDADSWTVQEADGSSRDAVPSELRYRTLSMDLIRAGAGFFYLIY
jgi:hypothetical protein